MIKSRGTGSGVPNLAHSGQNSQSLNIEEFYESVVKPPLTV